MRKLQLATHLLQDERFAFVTGFHATGPDSKGWFMALSPLVPSAQDADGTVTLAMLLMQKASAFCGLFGARTWLKELSPTDP